MKVQKALCLSIAAASSVILATATPAAAGDSGKSELEGPITFSAVSGDTAAWVWTPYETTSYQAANAVTWWEERNDPCGWKVLTRHLNKKDDPDGTRKLLDGTCQKTGRDDERTIARPSLEAITSIEVCTNGKDTGKRKIKGLRIWGRTVSAGKVADNEAGPAEITRANCNSWAAKKVSCPQGQVAVGLKIYHEDDAATGIALACRKVVSKK